jgi:hypothetical protein
MSTLSRLSNHIAVDINPHERKVSEVIFDAAARALPVIQELWGLNEPEDCRIYVMTSWWGFFFQSAPWAWKILLAVAFPLWCFRAQRTWPYSAAWTQVYGRRVVIGIKPPRLLETSDKSIGSRVYTELLDANSKLQHLTCHELTHACSSHLKLPAWLNEGLAAVTVDHYLGWRTFKTETLDLLRTVQPQKRPPSYRELSRMNIDAITYYAALGYWLVEYLEQLHPGFVKGLFLSAPVSQAIDSQIAQQLGIAPAEFWSMIPGVIADHFGTKIPA